MNHHYSYLCGWFVYKLCDTVTKCWKHSYVKIALKFKVVADAVAAVVAVAVTAVVAVAAQEAQEAQEAQVAQVAQEAQEVAQEAEVQKE
jgi:hypothetical protein